MDSYIVFRIRKGDWTNSNKNVIINIYFLDNIFYIYGLDRLNPSKASNAI